MRTKRISFIALFVMMMAALTMLFVTNAKVAKADPATFAFEEGAYVKLGGDGGLRFRLQMDETTALEIQGNTDETLYFYVASATRMAEITTGEAAEDLYDSGNAWQVAASKDKIYAGRDIFGELDGYYYANVLIDANNLGDDDETKLAYRTTDFVAVAAIYDASSSSYTQFVKSVDRSMKNTASASALRGGYFTEVAATYAWLGSSADYAFVAADAADYTALESALSANNSLFFYLDGIADENDLIHSFDNGTMREYTVTWKNGSNVLETDTVTFGSNISYDGEEPENGDDIFKGWKVGGVSINLATYTVTGNVDIVAEYIEETEMVVESFSTGTSIVTGSFYNPASTCVWNTQIVSSIAGASDEDNALVSGQMLKVSFTTMHLWGDSVYTTFAGVITNAFANTGYDYVTVKVYVDYTAEASWKWIQVGVTGGFEHPSSCGWLNIRITRAAWASDSKFYINSRNADNAAISPKLYFDEITGGFDNLAASSKTIFEDFSGTNIYAITNDLAVGTNTSCPGISTVTVDGSNGTTMAIQVNTWLGSVCYVKTGFAGIITNAFATTDYDYVKVKLYVNINSSRGWDRVYFGVGSNKVDLWQPAWLDLTVTRSEWTADPYFWIQPNPSGAYDVNLVFTVYFDEIYYEEEVENVNFLTKTGLTAEQLAGSFVKAESGTKTVLTAEQLAAYTPVSGDKIVLVLKGEGYTVINVD